MQPKPVIAIFDVGKTNKKFFLFDEDYAIVLERSTRFPEIMDEDGFPCDDLPQLTAWIRNTLIGILSLQEVIVKALNFSAYGASLVHIDRNGQPVAPLYNYLKPFSQALQEQFSTAYGDEQQVALATASPVLGNLNSGKQLYALKYEKPAVYAKIDQSLHLPQYLSYLVTGNACSDITGLGCHTMLWDFARHDYHPWVYAENLQTKLSPLSPTNVALDAMIRSIPVKTGIGLHDSSAALIPYLASFSTPFVLISTGTWCISLNPFNHDPLTPEELKQDCLCYLSYNGTPVKASRLFAGQEHEEQVKRVAKHFGVADDHYHSIGFNAAMMGKVEVVDAKEENTFFEKRSLEAFDSFAHAYHQLMSDLMHQQKVSTSLVLNPGGVTRIFVDGGFAGNDVYMNLLATAFPGMEVFAATISQASALGAALVIHSHWNSRPIPGDLISLKPYTAMTWQVGGPK